APGHAAGGLSCVPPAGEPASISRYARPVGDVPAPRRRLLVVDDEPGNRRLIARMFRGEFDIAEAETGEEALALASRMQPHVIITDQRMPGMSGVELLARLKDELPQAIRILVTAHADYGSLVNAVNAARIHHYVEKPFHTVDVRTVVDALSHTQ